MEFIVQLLPTETLHALGWTVLHSLWQAFAIALLLSAYLLGWQKTDARKRYIAGNVALVTTLLAAICTFFYYIGKSNVQSATGSDISADDGSMLSQQLIEGSASFFDQYFTQNMPLIVTLWLMGLVLFMLKLLGGLLYIQRLKSRMTAPLPKFWQEKLAQFSGELSIARPVRLLESALAKAPMVVGWFKPIILLPMGAVNNLLPSQVEAILAHELAHIARHDYLLNLLQSCVEILFYFNPAVWWVSASVRTERENCCDDIAVQLCGSSLAYAKALVSLQELQLAAPAFALSFSKSRNQLLHRIQRILQPSQNKSNVMEKLSATVLLTVAVLLLSVQANTPFGNLISRVVSKGLPSNDAYTSPADVAYFSESDTIPNGTRDAHIHFNTDEEEIEFKMKDDEITFLKVDGKVIPAEQYAEYESRIRDLMENTPEPPEAPEMPDFPVMQEMPAPPVPPAFHHLSEPPMPPTPPSRTRKIITQKDRNGTTFIIENEDGSDPVEITVRDGKKGTIIVNGQEINGMKKGDKTVILQDVPNGFGWAEGQLDAFHADHMQFELAAELAELQGFSPDVFALSGPDELGREQLRALQERLKSGSFNQEFLEDHARRFNDVQNSEQWREKLNEEIARMSADKKSLFENQQLLQEQMHEEMELYHERAKEDALLWKQHQPKLEKERQQMEMEHQKIEKERQKMRKQSKSGSM